MFPPKLLAGYGAESVPLESGSVDAVVSVFGIEYAELSEAIPEVSRLLVPEGRFDWVVHHADSIVSRMSDGRSKNTMPLKLQAVILGLEYDQRGSRPGRLARTKKQCERQKPLDRKSIPLQRVTSTTPI